MRSFIKSQKELCLLPVIRLKAVNNGRETALAKGYFGITMASTPAKRRAFEKKISIIYPRLFHHLWHTYGENGTLDAAEIDDIVQETALKAFQAMIRGLYTDMSNDWAFLRTIAYRETMNLFREKQKIKRFYVKAKIEGGNDGENSNRTFNRGDDDGIIFYGYDFDPDDPESLPIAFYTWLEFKKALRAIQDSEGVRILLMRYKDGKPPRVIAKELGKSTRAVSTKITRMKIEVISKMNDSAIKKIANAKTRKMKEVYEHIRTRTLKALRQYKKAKKAVEGGERI